MELFHDIALQLLCQVLELHRLSFLIFVALGEGHNEHYGLCAIVQNLLQSLVMLLRFIARLLGVLRRGQALLDVKVDLKVEVCVPQGLPHQARCDKLRV